MKANNDKINNLEAEFDQFQKQCEQMHDDLLNQMRNFIQNFQNGPPGEDKEHEATTDTKLFSTEDIQPLPVQEPPQNFDMHQIIEECCVEVHEQQKQNMEKTMLDLVKICHHKQFFCIHDDVDNLIESALDSKLLSINSINSQRLDKKEQEVKIVEEQPAERRNHIEKSLQNFRVIHKSSISLNTSQISSFHAVAPILSTREPKNSLNNSLLDNFLPEFETFCDHSEETRSGNTTHANYSLPEYDSFCFEIEPDQERLINLMKNDVPDNSSNDPLLEEVDLFLSDDSIPPGIENVTDDPEGDICFLEELLIDDFILFHESSDPNNPSISRPPLEPPDVESFFDLKPDMIAEEISDKLNEDKCFDPRRGINVSKKIEDDDYFPFIE
uniref:Reverse transcriptase domain-containing protein n=1 Tax=Tanacetum cinerariifolium TaxID=118510 RepID=A0A6L2NQS9_TANCI|nr:hypothetical protein [Tanacetum cinerariifolium]